MAVAAILSSCDKHESASQTDTEITDNGKVSLKVSVASAATRSTATWDEDAISSLCVFVFNADGSLDGYGSASSSSLTLTCTTGAGKSIYAVTNKSITVSNEDSYTFSDLEAVTSDLSDNSADYLVMSGWVVDKEIVASESVEVPVYRAAAKVSVAKIINSISDAAYKGETLIITGIYLVNAVVGAYPLCDSLETYDNITWANQTKYVSSTTYDTYLYDGMKETVSSTYSTPHYFYCYPNPTTENSADGEDWAEPTRLVIEATLGGDTYYYPITLTTEDSESGEIYGVRRNTHYHFSSITIKLRGSTSPDLPISDEEISFSVDVEEWVDAEMGDLTI